MTTLAPFELHRADSIAVASALLDELGDDAVIYSGGTELLLLMKLGFASYGHLVDVKPIDELQSLDSVDGRLVIGGAVSHRALERSTLVQGGWPDLVEMERRVANARVRATGTLGGNLAFADPHSDPATFLLAADATVTLARSGRRRSLGLSELVLGPYETALEPGELLATIEVPALPPGAAMAHLRFAFHERPAATVSAWIQCADGRVVDARVAVGSVGTQPVLVPDVRAAVVGLEPDAFDEATLEPIGQRGAEAADPVADRNGSVAYKRALVATLVSRALRAAAARALERGEQAT